MSVAKKLISTCLLTAALATPVAVCAELDERTSQRLKEAIAGEHREAADRARDVYRKPYATLEFLGLRDDMTVVEIWPGAGWYTEILAPVLKDTGTFYAAQFGVNPPYGYQRRAMGAFLSTLGANPNLYRQVTVTEFALPYALRLAPPASADMVLTFRNVHNLVMDLNDNGAYTGIAMKAAYDALKPGGIFGVVDHEWDDPATEDASSANGYISRQRTVDLVTEAGFELLASSEILRNPKDTKDHPQGVWTLPPTFAAGEQDRARYAAIGESDRFLLKFVKPLEAN